MIIALGCSTELGFVHSGGDLAFVHDIADLYKAETSIPVAFDVVAANVEDVGAHARRSMRDAMVDQRIVERCVRDVRRLILGERAEDVDDEWAQIVALWDGADGVVAAGVNYGGEATGEVDW